MTPRAYSGIILCLTQQIVHQTVMLIIILIFQLLVSWGWPACVLHGALVTACIVSASVAAALACSSWESSGGQKGTRQLRQPHRSVTWAACI